MGLLVNEAQAYGTAEHKFLVDEACKLLMGEPIRLKVNGTAFTLGEITSLAGDFYADPYILRAQASRARKFLDEHAAELERLSPIGEFASAVATRGTYLELATNNYSHFRFGSPTDNAPSLCTRYYLRAALMDVKRVDDALLHEGFALHFLTDLFAAGHMRTPRYEVTQHLLRPPMSYGDKNAAIIGGLLAKVQHDEDNDEGLDCRYQGVFDFLTLQSGKSLKRAKFYGDNKLLSTLATAAEHVYDVIVWDIVTAVPAVAERLMATSRGREMLEALTVWRALDAEAFAAHGDPGALHRSFIEATTPRPFDPPRNHEPLFSIEKGMLRAARPVDEEVVGGIKIRCAGGVVKKVWLELVRADLNVSWVSVNPYIDVDVNFGLGSDPFRSMRPYLRVKIDLGASVTPTSVNLIDKSLDIDGNDENVLRLFDAMLAVAKVSNSAKQCWDDLGQCALDALIPPAY
jgi:hypothetical protein